MQGNRELVVILSCASVILQNYYFKIISIDSIFIANSQVYILFVSLFSLVFEYNC